MTSSSKIAELASIISTNVKSLDEYLASNGLPFPSFDPDAPLKLPLPDDIASSQDTILSATTELRALLLGPIGILQYASEVNQ